MRVTLESGFDSHHTAYCPLILKEPGHAVRDGIERIGLGSSFGVSGAFE
jgi:hypothetical protein